MNDQGETKRRVEGTGKDENDIGLFIRQQDNSNNNDNNNSNYNNNTNNDKD